MEWREYSRGLRAPVRFQTMTHRQRVEHDFVPRKITLTCGIQDWPLRDSAGFVDTEMAMFARKGLFGCGRGQWFLIGMRLNTGTLFVGKDDSGQYVVRQRIVKGKVFLETPLYETAECKRPSCKIRNRTR